MNPHQLKKLILVLDIADYRQQKLINDQKLSYELHSYLTHIIEQIEEYARDNNISLE
jgi:hypothetical protein